MHVESILRRLQPIPGFVFDKVSWAGSRLKPCLWVHVRARERSRAICSSCFKKRPGYDVLDTRGFAFVPLWGLPVVLLYAMQFAASWGQPFAGSWGQRVTPRER
jgi:hypothetical protein